MLADGHCVPGKKGEKMNILVVDDETVQLESLRRGLKTNGYDVLEALSAEEALAMLEREGSTIDMILTDYVMPGMNGIEFLKKIREKHPSLPVVMMTAYGAKDLVINALRNRCDSFIEKPFTLEELINEIERTKFNMLQNANSHRLSELVSKFIHQMNNPLMCAMGSAQLGIENLHDGASIKRYMEKIIKAIQKIQVINKEMLDLGRAAQADFEKVKLSAVLFECLGSFGPLFKLKGIRVDKDLEDDSLPVMGSVFGLEQMFNNLILNAVDAMDGMDEKLLKIRLRVKRAARKICVSLLDTGCGIPEEYLGKVFTPYFSNKESGSGLGLAVVKDVVEKHNSTINISSRPGKGTLVEVCFPVRGDDLNT